MARIIYRGPDVPRAPIITKFPPDDLRLPQMLAPTRTALEARGVSHEEVRHLVITLRTLSDSRPERVEQACCLIQRIGEDLLMSILGECDGDDFLISDMQTARRILSRSAINGSLASDPQRSVK